MIVVAGCIVVLVAVVYFGIIRAPRGSSEVFVPDREARYAERTEPPPERVVHHVHHVNWPELDERPVPIEELTPAARALIEGGKE